MERNPIYMTRKEIGELVGYSHTAVDNRLAEIRKYQEKDSSRYRYHTATNIEKGKYATENAGNASKPVSSGTSSTSIAERKSGYMFNPSIVRKGSKGTSVLLLQEILKARGFKGADGKELALDRSAGNNTIYAINSYQTARRKQGVELGTNGKNDGSCGPKMWADLIAI